MRHFLLIGFLSLIFPACAMARPDLATDSSSTETMNDWLVTSTSTVVRVRVIHSKRTVRIGGNGPLEYRAARGGNAKTVMKAVLVRPARAGVSISGKTVRGSLWVRPLAAAHVLSINGRQYRGRFLVQTTAKGYLDVIEYVELDKYLYGVLPREVGSSWPLEALKAQAVISRTFALANRSENSENRFDLVNDVRSQVYGGLADEAPATNEAVELTRGEILVGTDKKPIQAFFHSSCGGFTEKPNHVWSSNVDSEIFASQPETACSADPYANWKLKISASTLRARLRRGGISVGEIKEIQMSKLTLSGRAERFLIVSRSGRKEVGGNRFRIAVGPEALRSTRLDKVEKVGKTFVFTGHGWGHGVGLCQWGAKGRAAAGETYTQILTAYYPGAVLVTQ